MTLTRGSFSYSSGEEYTGEWKEGKTFHKHFNLFTYLTDLDSQDSFHFHKCVLDAVLLFIIYFYLSKQEGYVLYDMIHILELFWIKSTMSDTKTTVSIYIF